MLQCQSSVSVSPWDTGNKFPDVTICCGGSINFQWSVRPISDTSFDSYNADLMHRAVTSSTSSSVYHICTSLVFASGHAYLLRCCLSCAYASMSYCFIFALILYCQIQINVLNDVMPHTAHMRPYRSQHDLPWSASNLPFFAGCRESRVCTSWLLARALPPSLTTPRRCRRSFCPRHRALVASNP